MTVALICGDALSELAKLPESSVHCVVTSPPYWGLRDYGVAGQLGLESTPEEHVANMVAVFREVRRVLRSDGTLWLNYGDSYAQGETRHRNRESKSSGLQTTAGAWSAGVAQTGRKLNHGLKPKDLVGMPWRIAFALQAGFSVCMQCGREMRSDIWPVWNGHRICFDCPRSKIVQDEPGWYLRSDIIWAKPNPMPESVTDRPTKSHEYVFLLTKSARYFYDNEAVKETAVNGERYHGDYEKPGIIKQTKSDNGRNRDNNTITSRNIRSVWTIATAPFRGAHFATFPPKLAETCIKAGTSEKGCCKECGAPLVRKTERPIPPDGMFTKTKAPDDDFVNRGFRHDGSKRGSGQKYQNWLNDNPTHTIGWSPTCVCPSGAPIPCTVLDPFAGAGTALMVADRLQRNAIGVELNPAYAEMAEKRIAADRGPLLAAMAAE